jgi:hypothetical protein
MSVSSLAAAASAVGLGLFAVPCYAHVQEVTMTQVATAPPAQPAAAKDDAIRPFRFTAPEAALVDLRRRISATKWPKRELVKDPTQGSSSQPCRSSRTIG